jgi:hypothetical protein
MAILIIDDLATQRLALDSAVLAKLLAHRRGQSLLSVYIEGPAVSSPVCAMR